MSALAFIARRRGVAVSGCDTDPGGAADLAAMGVRGLAGTRSRSRRWVLVRWWSRRPFRPTIRNWSGARALGIPVVPRKEALAGLVGGATVGGHRGHPREDDHDGDDDARRSPPPGWRPRGWRAGGSRDGAAMRAWPATTLFVVEADEYDQAFLTLCTRRWPW